MSDRINVYMDNLLEIYKDLQDVIINPVTPTGILRKDLQDHYDNMKDNIVKIYSEYDDDLDNSIMLRICNILSGIRMTVFNRFGTFVRINDDDTDDTIKNKKMLLSTLSLYETEISHMICKYFETVNIDNE